MKAIIEGKRYDTEKATLVTTWSNGYNPGDFHRCDEEIYRTEKGAWFIYGKGGALSGWAERHGSGTCGGSGIRPLEADEARAWLEEKGETAALEKHFGSEVEDA
jgi:hypothetical protein